MVFYIVVIIYDSVIISLTYYFVLWLLAKREGVGGLGGEGKV